MRRRHLRALVLVFVSAACADSGANTLTVGAASSLRHVLQASAPAFEAEHPDLTLAFSFAASSTLARQVQAGASYDVFLSADERNLERAAARLAPGSRRRFLANRLALVAASNQVAGVTSPAQLVETRGRIAVAMPAVPAGHYTREWLAAHDLLDPLEARFVLARNVRATLALVESGAVDWGFVYVSDLHGAAGLELVWSTGVEEAPRIAYHGACRVGAPAAALAYLDWLSGPSFQAAAEEDGFTRWRP